MAIATAACHPQSLPLPLLPLLLLLLPPLEEDEELERHQVGLTLTAEGMGWDASRAVSSLSFACEQLELRDECGRPSNVRR